MSNYLELCQKFQTITGITGSQMATAVGQTGMNLKIATWVADADEKIQKLWTDWKFLQGDAIISLVQGTDEYSLVTLGRTDLIEWKEKEFFINPGTANYAKLTPVPLDEWRQSSERLGVRASGQPSRVVVKADNGLVFIDKPDTTYTVWGGYLKKPTRMAADASTSLIPVAFEMAILHLAKMAYAEYYENWQLYNAVEQVYLNELVALESAQLPEQQARSRSANDPEDNCVVAE